MEKEAEYAGYSIIKSQQTTNTARI